MRFSSDVGLSTLAPLLALVMASQVCRATPYPFPSGKFADPVEPRGPQLIPPVTPAGFDATQALEDVRDRLERYENVIIHTILARYALGGSSEDKLSDIDSFLKTIWYNPNLSNDDDHNTYSLVRDTPAIKNFTSSKKYIPPTLEYALPATVAQDADLYNSVPGQGIFPTGRQPNDPLNVRQYYHDFLLGRSPQQNNNATDQTTANLLNTGIEKVLSERILTGVEVARIKFFDTPAPYCEALRKNDVATVAQTLTNQKQANTVLQRVLDKTNAWTKLQDSWNVHYPTDTNTTILKLFQAYLVPITTQVEVQFMFSLKHLCQWTADPN